jgi:hypothetical protein
MQRSILLLAGLVIIVLSGHTQILDSAGQYPAGRRMQPTQRAVRQLTLLQQRLHLDQDQVLRLNPVLLAETIALDSLRDHPTGDPKADGLSRRNILHDTDVRIYSELDENQQVQYVLWKQEQRIKNLERRQLTPDSTARPPR